MNINSNNNFLIILIIFSIFYIFTINSTDHNELPSCKFIPELECKKEKPCKWSDVNIWQSGKVPNLEICKNIQLDGGAKSSTGGKNEKYIEIDQNINFKSIEIKNGLTVYTSDELPVQSSSEPFIIENLQILNSNLILENIKVSSVINNLKLLDSSSMEIKSSNIKFERVEVLEGSIKFNVENSFIELIGDNTNDADGDGTLESELISFKIKPTFINSKLIIKFLDKDNKPNCNFEKGITSIIDKTKTTSITNTEPLESTASIQGDCIFYGISEFYNLKIESKSNIIINGILKSSSSNAFDISSNSIVRFQLPNDENDEDDKAAETTPSTSIDLNISNFNFQDSTSKLIIGNDGENNNQFGDVNISNIKNGIIELENVVEGKIRLSSLFNTLITTEIGNSIIIEKSTIQSIKSQGKGSSTTTTTTTPYLHLDNNVNIIEGINLNLEVIFGDLIEFGENSINEIGGGKSLIIEGQVNFKTNSILKLDSNRNIRINAQKDDMIVLNNSSITCYNITIDSGTISSIGQSTLNLNGNLVLKGNHSTLSISNKDDKLYQNKLIVNGDLKIYSSNSNLSFYKLGKESSHLIISGECLLDGNLNLHFSDTIESHSEYHVLQCNTGKYRNQFKSINLYLDKSLIDPLSYQIETSDTIYLITQETDQDGFISKTLNGWTVVTVLSISAFAILIITFYLFYKNKFKKQNNHYLPVELTDMSA